MVDPTFDCSKDSGGRDPDSHSPTLRRYHQILWSKPLPNGRLFQLDITGPKPFLVHRSELGEFHLTSDSITHSYATRATIRPLAKQASDEKRLAPGGNGWWVAECIVFPGKRIDGKNTINGARGMNSMIDDRFDPTLECIRRHYRNEASPLSEVLQRYGAFFALFQDFKGYVDFFLLQDLVSEDYHSVRFYLPFEDFTGSPLPHDLESYVTYIKGIDAFGLARARRMVEWCSQQAGR